MSVADQTRLSLFVFIARTARTSAREACALARPREKLCAKTKATCSNEVFHHSWPKEKNFRDAWRHSVKKHSKLRSAAWTVLVWSKRGLHDKSISERSLMLIVQTVLNHVWYVQHKSGLCMRHWVFKVASNTSRPHCRQALGSRIVGTCSAETTSVIHQLCTAVEVSTAVESVVVYAPFLFPVERAIDFFSLIFSIFSSSVCLPPRTQTLPTYFSLVSSKMVLSLNFFAYRVLKWHPQRTVAPDSAEHLRLKHQLSDMTSTRINPYYTNSTSVKSRASSFVRSCPRIKLLLGHERTTTTMFGTTPRLLLITSHVPRRTPACGKDR